MFATRAQQKYRASRAALLRQASQKGTFDAPKARFQSFPWAGSRETNEVGRCRLAELAQLLLLYKLIGGVFQCAGKHLLHFCRLEV